MNTIKEIYNYVTGVIVFIFKLWLMGITYIIIGANYAISKGIQKLNLK